MLDWLVWPFKKIRLFAKYRSETQIGHFFRTLQGRILLSAIYTILAWFVYSRNPPLQEINLLDGIIIEGLSIFFALLVIDYYRAQENERQTKLREALAEEQQKLREEEAEKTYKEDLVRRARSRSNNNALDAIDIIRERGWLDGTEDDVKLLEGRILKNADLSNGQLQEIYETIWQPMDKIQTIKVSYLQKT